MAIRLGYYGFSRLMATTPIRGLRAFSSEALRETECYDRLVASSERDKVEKIARTFLSPEEAKQFFNSQGVASSDVKPSELARLLEQVHKSQRIPIAQIGDLQNNREFVHFRDNFTFINLPYSEKVAKWSDRAALQNLIREKFRHLFEDGDLVVVPGCADGQIPIEVYGNSLKHRVSLDIVAADFNLPAMQLGYLTMKSYQLKSDRVHWVQADIKSVDFFNWVSSNFSIKRRHQVVTLVQPSLREESLLSLLRRTAELRSRDGVPTTLVMPVLLEDENSEWYKICDSNVQAALSGSTKTHDLPQLVWNKTKFGHEMLRLDASKEFYVPQQYFVRPDALPKLQEETGYEDFSDHVFGKNSKFGKADPRMITGMAKRMFCIWHVREMGTHKK
jgi:hypothetical protein